MGFLKSKAGLLAVLAALAALLGVLWYCFEGNGAQKMPEGTLVRHRAYGIVSLMADGAVAAPAQEDAA